MAIAQTFRLAVCVLVTAGLALAADPPEKKADEVTQVIVFSKRDKTVRIPEIKAIREVRNDQDQVILSVRAQDDGLGGKRYTVDRPTTKTVDTLIVRLPDTGDPKKLETNALELSGRDPGTVRLTITGADGKKVQRDVVVRRQVLLFMDETLTVQMRTPKAVKSIENDGKALQASQVEGDDKSVQLKGLVPADTRVTLVAADGERETIEVAVRSTKDPGKDSVLLLSLWQVRDLQMRSRKPLSKVVTENSDYVRVMPDSADPRHVKLETRQSGLVQVTLFDQDGKTETYEVVIRREKYRWQDEKNARMLTIGKKKLLGPTFAGPYKTQVRHMFGDGTLANDEVPGDARHRNFTADTAGVWAVTFTPEQPAADKAKPAKAEVYFLVAEEMGSGAPLGCCSRCRKLVNAACTRSQRSQCGQVSDK
jgi:hypothetical protein